MENQQRVNQNDKETSVASDNLFDFSNQEREEAKLSWRNDPLNNFSDWKLRIKIQEDPEKNEKVSGIVRRSSNYLDKTYYVHRNIIAIGERRSGYFANLLHYGIDDGDRCFNIELCSKAVDFFPDLLDFMYSSKAFELTTRNATALLFLSQAFQVFALERRVKVFIDEDIKLCNFAHYLSEALYFSEEAIALKVIETCENEAMSLVKDATPSLDLKHIKILRVPFLFTAIKAEKFCHNISSLLSHEQILLKTKKNIVQRLLRRKSCS
mmetsp:Transcript_22284/g.52980  ORF Transcript_22284/g.52980 Transcript_22284/m.52980 type:complete len:267 (+) Transcript_22284:164-964(+)|eukprot:CAMPEP_0197186054 /NCGR_PEP_ID=MMETSP1423-20130617/13110_1 /TAXON_ID=476441 /ORGANISM="Pseudo-nitzschia heimii, Strain UNC1101" /LENGTH=266 /DNA_ID=CAMNT_0042637259 /DNA_START=110 /DNA_END=910 /DNA_ORIENTATION=-